MCMAETSTNPSCTPEAVTCSVTWSVMGGWAVGRLGG
jgi:hypothetical protein